MLADALRKREIRGARENFKAVVVQEALAPDPLRHGGSYGVPEPRG